MRARRTLILASTIVVLCSASMAAQWPKTVDPTRFAVKYSERQNDEVFVYQCR
jgi:hypothetical protein